MIAQKVASTIAAVAVVGILGGGAIALANNGDEVSPTRSTTAPGIDDDGTADQGHGDAPGTAGAGDDDDSGSGGNSGPG